MLTNLQYPEISLRHGGLLTKPKLTVAGKFAGVVREVCFPFNALYLANAGV
tara:strand:+ start:113 stop:265 length:153 start_codon:yes stop_codon:yes gene_type:complete